MITFLNKSKGKMIRRKVYIDVGSSDIHARKEEIKGFRRDFSRWLKRRAKRKTVKKKENNSFHAAEKQKLFPATFLLHSFYWFNNYRSISVPWARSPFHGSPMLFSDMNRAKQNMAPQNSTLINLINDDIKSIASERLSPIEREMDLCGSDDEVGWASEVNL